MRDHETEHLVVLQYPREPLRQRLKRQVSVFQSVPLQLIDRLMSPQTTESLDEGTSGHPNRKKWGWRISQPPETSVPAVGVDRHPFRDLDAVGIDRHTLFGHAPRPQPGEEAPHPGERVFAENGNLPGSGHGTAGGPRLGGQAGEEQRHQQDEGGETTAKIEVMRHGQLLEGRVSGAAACRAEPIPTRKGCSERQKRASGTQFLQHRPLPLSSPGLPRALGIECGPNPGAGGLSCRSQPCRSCSSKRRATTSRTAFSRRWEVPSSRCRRRSWWTACGGCRRRCWSWGSSPATGWR